MISPMAVPWNSHFDEAIEALIATLETRIPALNLDPTFAVKDGEWVWGGSDPNVVVVGWSGFVPGYQYPSRSMSEELGGAAVTGQSRWEGMGPSILETFSIACASISRIGDTSSLSREGGRSMMSLGRSRAKSQANVIGGLLYPPWLSGTVAKAQIASSFTFHAPQTRRGIDAVLGFSIECEAYSQQ